MRRKSFTLIELLVVIAIIAILAAIIAPHAFRAIEKARIAAIISNYRSIKTAALAYNADTTQWPPLCYWWDDPPCNCTAGFVTDDGTPGWNGPYLEKWPKIESITLWGEPWFRGYCFMYDDAAYLELAFFPLTDALKIERAIDGVVYDGSSWPGSSAGLVHYRGMGGDLALIDILISTGED